MTRETGAPVGKPAGRAVGRLRRLLLAGFGVAIVLAATVAAYLFLRIEPGDYAALLNARAQELTGRSLSIAGRIGMSVSLVPTVSVEDVRFQNAPWGSRPDMLHAKRIEVVIALLPLLRGDVEIRALELVEPDLLLETNAAGAPNWIFDTPDTSPKRSAERQGAQPIGLHRARIKDGVVTYRDGKTLKTRRLQLDTLTLARDSETYAISAQGSVDSVPLALVGKTKPASAPDGSTRLEAKLTGAGATVSANGVIPWRTPSGVLDLALHAEVSDWSGIAKIAQISAFKLPPLEAVARLTSDADGYGLHDLLLGLGKSKANGSVRFATGERDMVFDAKLVADSIDLPELLGPSAPKPKAHNRVFSDEPFALGSLKAAKGRLDAQIGQLVMRDGRPLQGVSLVATMDHGKVKADPVRVRVGGRELRIRAEADAASAKALALDLTIQGTGIPLGALISLLDIAGTVEGAPTDVDVRVSGRGPSLRTLVAESSGEVRIVVGAGRVRGTSLDLGADITELLNVLNPARGTDPYTELKCAVVRLPIRRGVVRVDNSIAVETAKVHLIAAGVIDLRNETLDLGFRPKAVTGMGFGVGGLASLARLRGSLADPSVEADFSGAASAATRLGLAAITGRLSLLAGGMLAAAVPDAPCEAALTGKARTSAPPKEAKPSAFDGIFDGIKRIFQ